MISTPLFNPQQANVKPVSTNKRMLALLLLGVVAVTSCVALLLSGREANMMTTMTTKQGYQQLNKLFCLNMLKTKEGDEEEEEDLVTTSAHGVRAAFGLRSDMAITSTTTTRVLRENDDMLSGVDLDRAIKETQQSLSLIYNRYECASKLGEAFMLIQQNILGSDWDLIKLRFAEKILSETGSEEARYRMVFGGSSVTAGHDNGINVSYPLIVNKRMHTALAAAGIDLQVHNIAQGANNCLPSNMCYESMGGHDPDFVAWEQSFNCGRDSESHELPTRFAAWSKTPGSVYFSNSGSINPVDCKASEFKKPWSDEDWSPGMEGLSPWRPGTKDVAYWKQRFNFAYTNAGSTSKRFGGGSYVYRDYGLAVLGQDLWGTYKPEEICDAAPEMTGLRCSPEVFYSECLMKMMRKEASVYGKGRGARHHPSQGVHQIRGELISFLYSLIFLDALYDVQAQVGSSPLTRQAAKMAREKFSAERASMVKTTTIPEPVACGSYYCDTKPHCHTNYRSHFSEDLFLSQQIVGKLTWQSEVSRPEGADVHFHESREGYSSSDSADSIHLKMKIGQQKFVMVCSYHFPHAHHAMEYSVELNVDPSRLNAAYEPRQDKVVNLEANVKVEPGWGCQKVHNLPEGQHVLGIRYKTNEKKATAGITHLITWD